MGTLYQYINIININQNHHDYGKISKGFFPLTRPCDESSGRADDGADRRGAVSAGRIVGWDRRADPHTWTSVLQWGVPPYREKTELLADDSAPTAYATTAIATGSSVKDGGVGCSSMPRVEWQWNRY